MNAAGTAFVREPSSKDFSRATPAPRFFSQAPFQ
jgi:hypothetical protein